MKITFSAKTDTGKHRRENQDSYGISEGKNIYFLCDGMGGAASGDFASRCAGEIMLRAFDLLKTDDINRIIGKAPAKLSSELLLMIAATRLANRALFNFSSEYHKLSGMGTTITSVCFDSTLNIMHIFHVGDSRVYRLRNGAFELLTKDHSKVNELIEQGKMTEEEVKTVEIQSMITRALGTAPKVKIDYRYEYVREDDCFLLCTDGLNGEIDDTQIKNIMIANKSNLDAMSSTLIDAANNAGGRDNTTVITLKVYDDKKSELPPYDSRPGKVITIEEETPEETKSEDKILKKFMSDAKIEIPKSIRKRKLLENPLFLGMIFAFIVALFGVYMNRCSGEHTYDTNLADLAGKATGLKLDIREPTADQYQIFSKSEDTVTKLQIIQDWYKDSGRYTVPLKDVEVSVSDGKERFKAMTSETPLQIKLERGTFALKLNRSGYAIVSEKMEIMNSIDISLEPAANFKPILLIMIPQP